MAFTYDTTNNVGKVRALVGDTVEADAKLADADISVYLDLTSNDLYLSAAMGLRAMAAKLGNASKRIKAGDYEEDTSKKSVDMIALAKSYEDKANNIPAEAQSAEILTDMNYNQILTDRALRDDPD